MAQAARKICEICTGGPGSQFCLDCEQLFCDNCKLLHKRQKSSANHKFLDGSGVEQEVKSKCKEHSEDLVFLCSPCNKFICTACVVGNHKGHDLSRISDELTNLKKENHAKLLSKSEVLNVKIKQLEKGLIQLDKDVATAIKQVTEEGARIKSMIDRQVEDIINDLRSKTGTEKENVDKIISDTKQLQTKMKELEERHLELQKNRNDTVLLEKLKSLNSEITKIEVVSVSSHPSVVYKTKEASEKDIDALMGYFILSELKLETSTNSTRSASTPRQLSDAEKEEEFPPYPQFYEYPPYYPQQPRQRQYPRPQLYHPMQQPRPQLMPPRPQGKKKDK